MWAVLLPAYPSVCLVAQDTTSVRSTHDSVQVRFVDTDLRAVIQALGRHLPKPVIVGPIPDTRVSMETPGPVPSATLIALLANLVQSQGLEFTEDSVAYRVAQKAPLPIPQGGTGPRADSAVQLFVVRLKHARAQDVAATVNQLFGGSGEFTGSGLSTNTLSDELRRNRVPTQGTGGQPQLGQATGANLAGAVTIVPDELTNSLLIRASARDFDLLKQAIDQLDIRPLQVLIEVLIVEAQHNRNFSLGTSLFVPPQSVDRGDGTAGGSYSGSSLGDFALQLLNIGHAQVDATITAAATRGDVEIISRPILLASNNTEAHILIGTQEPFVQVSRSLPTDTPTRDQVVQYEPVGTKLTVRPTINEDGYVSLAIEQEVSSAAGASTVAGVDAPVISTREAFTQVLVRDGQTIVLGGLRDLEHDKNQGGIPILSSIPILGGLFGSASRTNNQSEFYLFLTPRILRTDADADSVTVPRLPKGGAR